jgi:hypothetical protein
MRTRVRTGETRFISEYSVIQESQSLTRIGMGDLGSLFLEIEAFERR